MQVLRQQAVGQMLVAERQVQAVAGLGQAKPLVVGRLGSWRAFAWCQIAADPKGLWEVSGRVRMQLGWWTGNL